MKSTFFAGLLAASASVVTAQYYNQSAPFNLIVASRNSTLNGSTLTACHEGAAIEGLCLGAKNPTSNLFSYNFNTTDDGAASNSTIGAPGYLTYLLHGGNFNFSEPLELSYNPITNVAVPLFTPADSGTAVAFDSHNRLNLQGYLDDRTYPLTYDSTGAYYRWYVCDTDVGYTYKTLAWVMGEFRPENPTCVKVDVIRVFT